MNEEPLQDLKKYGAFAAFANALLIMVILIVDFAAILFINNSDRFSMMLYNSGLLLVQGALKLFSLTATGVLIVALSKRIAPNRSPLLRAGPLFGFVALLLLLVNACMSFYAIAQTLSVTAGDPVYPTIDLLDTASMFIAGFWYLVENWVARQSKILPTPLANLGLVVGIISLVPQLWMIVLVLSLVWSVWLGAVWWRDA